jgi:hypothetical protein
MFIDVAIGVFVYGKVDVIIDHKGLSKACLRKIGKAIIGND